MFKDPVPHTGPRVHADAGGFECEVSQPVRHLKDAHHQDEKIRGDVFFVFLAYPSSQGSWICMDEFRVGFQAHALNSSGCLKQVMDASGNAAAVTVFCQ